MGSRAREQPLRLQKFRARPISRVTRQIDISAVKVQDESLCGLTGGIGGRRSLSSVQQPARHLPRWQSTQSNALWQHCGWRGRSPLRGLVGGHRGEQDARSALLLVPAQFRPCRSQISQSSHTSPGTRANSETLCVTSVRLWARAIAAISRSCAPIRCPMRSRAWRTSA
jgi:hypothetical protein